MNARSRTARRAICRQIKFLAPRMGNEAQPLRGRARVVVWLNTRTVSLQRERAREFLINHVRAPRWTTLRASSLTNLTDHSHPTPNCTSLRSHKTARHHRLDNADAVRHVEGIVVAREAAVSLLVAVRADEGVHLRAVDVVQALHRILDLLLVRARVDDEDESVVVLRLRQRGFVRERVLQDLRHRRTNSARDRSVSRTMCPSRSRGASAMVENPKRAARVDRSSPRTWKRSSLALDGTETRGYAGLRSCLSVRGLSCVETVSGQSSRSHPSRSLAPSRVAHSCRPPRLVIARTCGTSRRIASSKASPWHPSSRTWRPCSPCSPSRLRRRSSVSRKALGARVASRVSAVATVGSLVRRARSTRSFHHHRSTLARVVRSRTLLRRSHRSASRRGGRDGGRARSARAPARRERARGRDFVHHKRLFLSHDSTTTTIPSRADRPIDAIDRSIDRPIDRPVDRSRREHRRPPIATRSIDGGASDGANASRMPSDRHTRGAREW